MMHSRSHSWQFSVCKCQIVGWSPTLARLKYHHSYVSDHPDTEGHSAQRIIPKDCGGDQLLSLQSDAVATPSHKIQTLCWPGCLQVLRESCPRFRWVWLSHTLEADSSHVKVHTANQARQVVIHRNNIERPINSQNNTLCRLLQQSTAQQSSKW